MFSLRAWDNVRTYLGTSIGSSVALSTVYTPVIRGKHFNSQKCNDTMPIARYTYLQSQHFSHGKGRSLFSGPFFQDQFWKYSSTGRVYFQDRFWQTQQACYSSSDLPNFKSILMLKLYSMEVKLAPNKSWISKEHCHLSFKSRNAHFLFEKLERSKKNENRKKALSSK